MAITIATSGVQSSDFNAASGIPTSGAVNMAIGQLATVTVVLTDNNPAGIVTMTNNNDVGMTWAVIQDASAGGVRVVSFWARATASGNRQFIPTWDSGNNLTWALYWAVHDGADTGGAPIGSSSKGTGASSVSYPITPAGAGSAAWLIAADGNATGPQTMTAGSNTTLFLQPDGVTAGQGITTEFCSAMFAPSTNPRTDSSAFTMAETHTGSGVSWVGFEVKAANTQSQAPRSMHQYRQRLAA